MNDVFGITPVILLLTREDIPLSTKLESLNLLLNLTVVKSKTLTAQVGTIYINQSYTVILICIVFCFMFGIRML